MKGKTTAERVASEGEVNAPFQARMDTRPNSFCNVGHRCGVSGFDRLVQNFDEHLIADDEANGHLVQKENIIQNLEQNSFGIQAQVVDDGKEIRSAFNCDNAISARGAPDCFGALAKVLKTSRSNNELRNDNT